MTKIEAFKAIASMPDNAEIQVHRDWQQEIRNEVAQLKVDIDTAYNQAFCAGIIDTMSTADARALFYVKGVCERFVSKHKDLRMI